MAEAPTEADARAARERFRSEFDAKYPKATAKARPRLEDADSVLRVPRRALAPPAHDQPDREQLRDRSAAHQGHKGAGSKQAALAMAYKLLDAAQQCWRRVNGHELVADVLDDVKFKDGIPVSDDTNHEDQMTEEKVAV
jgi:hypothetical protein